MKKAAVAVAILVATAGCSQYEAPKADVKTTFQTYKVTSQKIPVYIEATGTVQPDLEGGAKILSPLSGVVERIFVNVGDPVKRGTPLVVVRSPDVNDTYSSYLSTQAQLKQAERAYNVNRQLFDVGAVTKNDLLASEASYEQLKALAEGLNKKLEIYGAGSREGYQPTLTLKAPIDARVADIQAHIGDRFDTGTALMTLANARRNVVVANIHDTDLPKLRKGETVTFSTDIFPDRQLNGVVSYISDVVDPDAKTVKVFIRIRNPVEDLKQNMFLRIRLLIEEKTLPVVPNTSILYKNQKFYVNVRRQGQNELKEVVPVMDASDRMVAVEGLRDGEEIVSSAIDLVKP